MDLSGITSPSDAALQHEYAEIAGRLGAARSPHEWTEQFAKWDGLRRTWRTFGNVTSLRYSQDTKSDAVRIAQRELDRRTPGVTALDKAMKQRFLVSDARPQMEREIGDHAFNLWDADVSAFDDSIAADLVRESELSHEYTELLSGAEVPFDGERRSLGGLGRYLEDHDRETRHSAERARWSVFEANAEKLDRIFDDLVRLRHGIARKLGYSNFTEVGYRRMRRVDYGPSDVAAYRDEVARVVVPFAHDLIRKGAAASGIDRAYFWDESTLGAKKRIAPLGDKDWIMAQTKSALASIDPSLGDFCNVIVENQLFDVENRPGKALGAFCTQFYTRGVPFVFANFNGSRGDIKTLMHELGHAFQAWSSRGKSAIDYLSATSESAEIHSMALEYLSWPEMERYFGADAGAYRREHLTDAMLFLPYGVAVDHFQHLVYENPTATPAERHAMWKELERRYMPWRAYGDLAFPAKGALWQEKRHIYTFPFYYIDYTLALCCALQFWERAQADRPAALDAYTKLCARGGEAPFRELVRSAGLRSPFEAGALADVVTAASAAF